MKALVQSYQQVAELGFQPDLFVSKAEVYNQLLYCFLGLPLTFPHFGVALKFLHMLSKLGSGPWISHS